MPGTKDKSQEREAAADFFGDDDLDWFDDDSEVIDREEARRARKAARTPAGDAEPASTPSAASPAATSPSPDETPTLDATVDDPDPTVEVDVEAEGAAAPEAAATEPARAAPKPPVAPPPPPPYIAPKAPAGPSAGFLDSILPRTLEPPRLATTPPPVGRTPEMVEALGVDARPRDGFVLPTGEEAWRENVAVLEAEAEVTEDAVAKASLLVQAAHVRLRRLRDAAGARTRLDEADALEPLADPAALALRTAARGDQSDAAAAWEARARAAEGAAASDAWRRCARLVGDATAERSALEAALQAEPGDVLAAERLFDLLAGDTGARLALVDGWLAGTPEPSTVVELQIARGRALADLGRADDAVGAWREALALDPLDGGAWAAAWSAAHDAGDHATLADLYAHAAEHLADDAPTWAWLAAVARSGAGDADAAAEAWRIAADAGSPVAVAQAQAWFLAQGRYDAALDVTRGAIGDDDDAGAVWFATGVALEQAGAPADVVLTAWRASAEAGFDPAGPAVERALRAAGGHDELITALTERVAAWDVPRAADLRALAEALEARSADDAEALERYRQAADKGDVDALRGLVRVARRRGDGDALGWGLQELASREVDPDLAGAHAFEAGELLARSGAHAEAVAWFDRASTTPSMGAALATRAAARALDADGRPAEAASRLEAHAATLTPEACVPWLLLAARLRMTDDVEAATATLDGLLERVPGHADALRLLGRLAGSRRPALERARLEEAGGAANALACAILDTFATGHVPDTVQGPFAGRLRDLAAAREGTPDRWMLTLSADLDEPVRLQAAAWLAATSGRGDVDAILARADSPSTSLARLAEVTGRGDRAAALGGEALPGNERVRLAVTFAATPAAALAAVRPRLGDPDATPAQLAQVARLAAAAEDGAVRLEAEQLALARAATPGTRAAHAWRVAALATAGGDATTAAAAWEHVLTERPGSAVALQGLLDARIALRDADGIVACMEAHAPDDARTLAEALDTVGDPRAAEAWARAATSGALLDRLGHEQALVQSGAWSDLFDAWTARADVTRAEGEKERLGAKRRWVLAEKLAATDRAWDLYRQLHDEAPDDRDVLESLARIAGVRGEVELATGYLASLVQTASEPREAARYQRRIAEVHLEADDAAAARQAFHDALDHDPEDIEALEGLAELARRDGDAEALHAVLKRQAGVVGEPRRSLVQRELARVAQDDLHDTERALDAWRTVLAAHPGDDEALRRLVALADERDDVELFLEMGDALAAVVGGAERSALLRRMGERCQSVGRHEDAVYLFEQAISAEVPDLLAAERVEAAYRAINDHVGVVRALLVQSELKTDPAERIACLLAAARVELDERHERDAAHRVYERVLQLEPEQVDALRFEAAYLYEMARYAEALPVHERLEPIVEAVDDEDDYDVRMEMTAFFYRFAEMLRADGRAADARRRYERALALNPSHLPTLEAIGPMYVADGMWKQAGEVYQKLLQLTGGQGEPEHVAHTFTMLGLVELETGRQDKAFKRFNRALEAFSNYVPALKGLARVYQARGEWQAVLTAYNGVIYNATVPQDVIDAYMTKGRILDEQMGRPDKAAQHYERSLAFDAEQPEAYLRLSEMSLREAQWDDAVEHATKGLGFARTPWVVAGLHTALAVAKSQRVEPEAAAEHLAQVAQVDEDFAAALGDDPLADPAGTRRVLFERLAR
ncbi:MAG: tetratricopeptide repeat protein [Alphaproteobacteria bacterium]|nr:tetratricopeptide repeat protein [Alphaproteobacteria bacterium]